jgi:signal transduction histidine kinase
MRQRAESLPGGRFEFESGVDGTRVGVSFVHPEARPS